MSMWSSAVSLYNPLKIKQLSLLTIRELLNMLPVIIVATALITINIFFFRLPYIDTIITAFILFYATLTTRSSAGLKNMGYYFRYSWLLIIALLFVALSDYAYNYASFLSALILLITIFILLRMADVCMKNAICSDDFFTPLNSLTTLWRGLPLISPLFLLVALLFYGLQHFSYFMALVPLTLSLLVIWCTNWYIIALYEQR